MGSSPTLRTQLLLCADDDVVVDQVGLERLRVQVVEVEVRDAVADVLLNHTAERPCAHRLVVTLLDQPVLCVVADRQRNVFFSPKSC